MTKGLLVYPDLVDRNIEFEIDQAAQFLGGLVDARVAVAFQDDGSTYAALYNAEAREEGAAPNPVASMGRNTAATGDPTFFTDPASAICGPVIFVGSEGEDIGEEEIERVKDGIRAVKNYVEDYPEEFGYWRSAVLNLGSLDA